MKIQQIRTSGVIPAAVQPKQQRTQTARAHGRHALDCFAAGNHVAADSHVAASSDLMAACRVSVMWGMLMAAAANLR
jgi:hypothetical protein